MSMINYQLWASEFADLPMPENCTYEMFYAACRQKQKEAENEMQILDFKIKQLFAEKGVDYE